MELIVVIMIVGILGAIAMPRFFDNRSFQERGYYENLTAGLKFAQKLAVASGCPVRVQVDAGGYEARQQQALAGRCDPSDTSFSTLVVLADGQALLAVAPSGVTASPNATIVFDALGRTDLVFDQTINVGSYALIVRADSGYIDAP